MNHKLFSLFLFSLPLLAPACFGMETKSGDAAAPAEIETILATDDLRIEDVVRASQNVARRRAQAMAAWERYERESGLLTPEWQEIKEQQKRLYAKNDAQEPCDVVKREVGWAFMLLGIKKPVIVLQANRSEVHSQRTSDQQTLLIKIDSTEPAEQQLQAIQIAIYHECQHIVDQNTPPTLLPGMHDILTLWRGTVGPAKANTAIALISAALVGRSRHDGLAQLALTHYASLCAHILRLPAFKVVCEIADDVVIGICHMLSMQEARSVVKKREKLEFAEQAIHEIRADLAAVDMLVKQKRFLPIVSMVFNRSGIIEPNDPIDAHGTNQQRARLAINALRKHAIDINKIPFTVEDLLEHPITECDKSTYSGWGFDTHGWQTLYDVVQAFIRTYDYVTKQRLEEYILIDITCERDTQQSLLDGALTHL